MDYSLHLHLSVAELLARHPECIPLFLHKRMACVGCLMAPFETLADVARNYGLPDQDFLAELSAVVESPSQGATYA